MFLSQILRMAGCTLAMASLFAGTTRARDDVPIVTESDYYADLPTVLSASRLSQARRDAPVATSIIDREMIEASGARQISDLFRLVPGMVVGISSGVDQVVSYQGLSGDDARRMQVLVDGREVYAPSTGGVPWVALPIALADIERIEVVRGPNAATYGANSYLGVINITTRHAYAAHGTALNANVGTHDIRDADLRIGSGDGDFDYRLTVGTRGDDGLSELNDAGDTSYLNARADWDPNGQDELSFLFGYSDGDYHQGEGLKSIDPMRAAEFISRYGQFNWRHDFSKQQAIQAKLYYSDENYGEDFIIDEPSLGVVIPTGKDFRTERFDGELQYTVALSPALRMALGAGARSDRAVSEIFLGTDVPLVNHLGRVFWHGEWRARPDIVVNAGVMWESSSITGNDVSPRLALNWHVTDAHTLRAGVSRAVRTPVIFEENANWAVGGFSTVFNTEITDILIVSSGGLKSEKIQSWEIGYFGRPIPELTLDIRMYRNRLTDLISSVKVAPVPADCVMLDPRNIDCDVRDYANTDAVRAQGVEVETDWQSVAGTRLRLTYALQDMKGDNVGYQYTISAPRHNFGLLAIQKLPWRARASVGYYSQSSMAFLSEDEIPHQRRLDLKLAKTIDLPGADGEIALTGQNVLGNRPEFRPTQFLDSRVYASFGLKFQ